VGHTAGANLGFALPASQLQSLSSLPWVAPSDEQLKDPHWRKLVFWAKADWDDHSHADVSNNLADLVSDPSLQLTQRGPSRMKNGENVKMKYVRNVDGEEVSAARAADIRKGMYEIWQYLQGKGKLPDTWGQADIETAAFYRNRMRDNFPELGLCEANWKADKVATDNYSHWYRRHILKKVSVKQESADLAEVPSKRCDMAVELRNAPQKKMKSAQAGSDAMKEGT